MHPQGSRSPSIAPPDGCTKGCSEICEDCSSFELGPDWDLEAVAAIAASADLLAGAAGRDGAPIAPPEARTEDRQWLETRLADVAAKLEATLKAQDPAPALDRFGQRLDNFEARVEAAVGRAAAVADGESLRFIEERVREIDDQFGRMSAQIGRLSTIDARVAEIWDRVQLDLPAPPAGLPKLVEGAVSRAMAAANVIQAEGASAKAAELDAFARIESALQRLIERVESIEMQGDTRDPEPADPACDIDLINRAYEEGARALGLILPETAPEPVHRLRALHAAHYAPRNAGDATGTMAVPPDPEDAYRFDWTLEAPAEAEGPLAAPSFASPPFSSPPFAPPAAATQASFVDATLESFKASALRARQRAQAMAESLGQDEAAGSIAIAQDAGPDGRPGATPDDAAAAHAPAKFQVQLPSDPGLSSVRPADFSPPPSSRPQSPALSEPRRSLAQGRWNRGFFVTAMAVLLGGAIYLTMERLSSPPEAEGRSRNLAPQRTPAAVLTHEISGRKHGGPADLTVPSALTPPAAEDVGSGAEARVAALPATIASASLRHAAVNGDPVAEFEIGARFSEGRAVKADPKQAFLWYQRSATRGFAPAQFRLAAHFERGLGVEKDAERAKIWYRRAAQRGHVKAMHNLAVLMAAGEDADGAVHWFREAAERNLRDSQFNLAAFFESGQGVSKNLAEAFKWYSLAARSGDIEAGRRMELVRSQLSRREILAAEQAVREWQPTPLAEAPGQARASERAAP